MMKHKDFAIFILTHGRADNQITYKTLSKAGYTGKLYFVIDNEDKQQKRYKELYGDKVIVFDKAAMEGTFDIMDNFKGRNVVVFARNALNDIAKELGIKVYMVLDDDYTHFEFRINKNETYPSNQHRLVKKIDKPLKAVITYFDQIQADCIALNQGGDYIGGGGNAIISDGYISKRKIMNSFIIKTDNPFQFVGRINEDTNTYVDLGRKGKLFLSIPFVSLTQLNTQTNEGGLTEFYLETGTYYKSFYTVMLQPSSVHCSLMGNVDMRLHHYVKWKNTVPMIIREDHKKAINASEA